MKKEWLTDAIGGIDDADLEITDEVRDAAPRQLRERTRNRRILILAAVCVFLMAVGFTHDYVMEFLGDVGFGKEDRMAENEQGTVILLDQMGICYVTFNPKDVRIPLRNIHGKILKAKQEIKQKIERAEKEPYWRAVNSFAYNGVVGGIESAEAGAEYVGYKPLRVPKPDLDENIGGGGYSVIGDEKTAEIQIIELASHYGNRADGITAGTTTLLYTDKYPTSADYTQRYAFDAVSGVEMEKRTVVENNREFIVVTGLSYDGENMQSVAFWMEDKVIYILTLTWRKDMQEEAERVLLSWMRSF
ncbi:MAG: hypothetical protein IK055_11010 [Lachnospiraceae bacterium]|nr:hypothetical protein [Lachnospiraceae bacterium]